MSKYTREDYFGHFDKLCDIKSRYLVLRGSAGSGKSHFAALKVLWRIMEEPTQHRIMIVRKTFPSLRKSCFALLQDKMRSLGVESRFQVNKSDMTITYANGSQIITASMDDPEKIKSVERVTSVWIEEPTELNFEDFTQIDLRLRGEVGTYKQIIMTFNPISKLNWIYKTFYEQAKEDCTLDHSTIEDNWWIDENYKKILDDLKNQDQTLYQIYRLGEWGVLGNLIYSNYDEVDSIPEGSEIIWGLDFGFNNPTALVQIGIKDQEPYIQERLYDSKLTNADLVARLESIITNKNECIYADSAEPARIEEIRQAGLNVHPAEKSVKDGIDYVKRKKLHVVKGSDNLFKELQSYKWKEDKNGNVLDEPVKYADHGLDGTRYGLYTHFKNQGADWGFVSIGRER